MTITDGAAITWGELAALHDAVDDAERRIDRMEADAAAALAAARQLATALGVEVPSAVRAL